MYLPEERHPYGRPNRPSTPVGDVLSNYYGENAEKEISVKYDIIKETSKPLGLSYSRGHTRASAMAHNHVNSDTYLKSFASFNDTKDIFKMNKFKNVSARTDTFKERSRQYNY